MAPPERLWVLQWAEDWRDRPQERTYRNPARAARQTAAILAAPDEIARLRGLFVTDGWEADALHWQALDPAAFVAEHDEETLGLDGDESEALTLSRRIEIVTASWDAYPTRQAQEVPS